MRWLVVLCAAAGTLVLAAQPQAPAAVRAATVRVSLLRGEQLVMVSRPGRNARDAVSALIAGPTPDEVARGYRSSVPRGTHVRCLTIHNGVATLDVGATFVSAQTNESLVAAVTQAVKTLSTFPQIDRVHLLVAGRPMTRRVEGIPLDKPISLHFLETPNVPLPQPPSLRLPAPDPAVKAGQKRLIALRYLLAGDDDGRLGPTTSEGILAFQKVEGLERTGVLDAATRARLATASPPTPVTHGGVGKRAEILLDRQVGLLIEDERVVRAIAVSSGKASTPTPAGSYRVYAKIPHWWSVPFREWLPWALPFVGGIAFHEFAVVPVYPASHGCVRQSFAVARWTYDFAEIGMPVRVLARS